MRYTSFFFQWKPYEQYEMSECRGIFLEELTLKYLKTNYKNDTIYPESKIIIDNYSSHTWDMIINLDKYYKLYECKYSTYYLKRKHLDNMISLKNKLKNSRIYLVIYENKTLIDYVIKKLKMNTNKDIYEENIKKINIFTLENFVNRDLL